MNQIDQFPELFALLITLSGLGVAVLFSRLAASASKLLKSTANRLNPDDSDAITRRLNDATVGKVVFYIVLAVFLLLAMRVLGLSVVDDVLVLTLNYIPNLILGVFIILGGYLLGILAKSLIQNLMPENSATTIPLIAQYLVVIAAVVTGLGQMAVDVSFLATLLLIILGTVLGALSLAFALGAKTSVENMLARRDIDHYQIGDVLKLEGAEGKVVEFTASGLILETAEGRLSIPATLLANKIVLQKYESST